MKKAEGRRQKAEGRRQKAEGRRQRAEGRGKKAEEGRRRQKEKKEKGTTTTVNCQLSTANCQLSIVNCQLPTVNCQLSIVNYQLSTMIQIFGEFVDRPSTQEYLIIGFSPSSIPLQQRWRNNGLSADFLADYLTTFFPGNEEEPASLHRQAEIKSAVSYIANELLENAMKFNDENSEYPIDIKLHLESDGLIFSVANSISPQAVDKFQAYIQELLTCDPSEMYIQKLEKNAADENSTGSGLGLLTLLSDYTAKIGWKFETVQKDPEVIAVTTMVQLKV